MSRFHLAVLDFDMPVLNGFQLSLRLRAARATFPIVLLSGMSRQLPNDMRNVFSSCLDKGEPIHLLLDTVCSCLTSISEPPTWQVIGSTDQSLRLKTEVPESTEQEPLFCGFGELSSLHHHRLASKQDVASSGIRSHKGEQ
jgi:hypothetical protein